MLEDIQEIFGAIAVGIVSNPAAPDPRINETSILCRP